MMSCRLCGNVSLGGLQLVFTAVLLTLVLPLVAMGVDVDNNGLDDALEVQLAKKFRPTFVLHQDRLQEPEPVEVVTVNPYLMGTDLMAETYDESGAFYGEHVFCESFDSSTLGYLCDPSGLQSVLRFDNGNDYDDEFWYGPDRYRVYWHTEYGWPDEEDATVWRNAYQNGVSGRCLPASNFAPTVYAHLFQQSGNWVIQYWIFYPYNDWIENHEGDWEHINVVISSNDPASAEIVAVDYYFHHFVSSVEGNLSNLHVVDATHPVIYVGGWGRYHIAGSVGSGHESGGSYPAYGNWVDVGADVLGEGMDDRIDPGGKIIPYQEVEVVIYPRIDRHYNSSDEDACGYEYFLANPEKAWMRADMRWGNRVTPSQWEGSGPITEDARYSPRTPAYKASWESRFPSGVETYTDQTLLLNNKKAIFVTLLDQGEVLRGEPIVITDNATGTETNLVSPALQRVSQSDASAKTIEVPLSITVDGEEKQFYRWEGVDPTVAFDNLLVLSEVNQSNALTASYTALGEIPQLLAPIDVAFESPTPVEFVWLGVEGALAYELQVASNASFSAETILLNTYSAASNHEWPIVRDEGTLYWRVRAYTGSMTIWSDVRAFDYDFRFMPVETTPVANAFGEPANATIRAVLNLPIDSGTISAQTVRIRGSQSGAISATRGLELANHGIYAIPESDLFAGETVTAVLGAGLISTDGTPLEQQFSWSFDVAGSGSGTYLSGGERVQPGGSTGIALADVDQDGDPDIISAQMNSHSVTVMRTDGGGLYQPYAVYPSSSVMPANFSPLGVIPADFDGDGDIDLMSNNFPTQYSFYENDGMGSFGPGEIWGMSHANDIAAIDIDGDGDLDLAAATNSGFQIHENQGDAVFIDGAQTIPLAGYVKNVAIGDMNGDGSLDAVATFDGGGDGVAVIVNDGAGTFEVLSQLPMINDYPVHVTVADIDNDGDLDIAAGHLGGDAGGSVVRVFRNAGEGTFPGFEDYVVAGGELNVVEPCDIDADGDLDLVAGRTGTSSMQETIVLMRNDGFGGFSDIEYLMQSSGGANYRPNGFSFGDLDGDGSLDIAASEFQQQATSILYNQILPEAVLLESPVADKILHDSTPLLRWYQLPNYGVEYDVQVSATADFNAPLAAANNLVNNFWTVDPSIRQGDYYWRVRASNSIGVGAWSQVRQFTYSVSPSCPVLFSYDGEQFVEHNPLLTACEKSGYRESVTDYYQLPVKPASINGILSFELRELENEITYLEDVALIAVDHPVGTHAICTVDGRVSLYTDTVSPLSAVDESGVDCLDILMSEDGVMYESDTAGQLIVTFPNTEGMNTVSLSAPKKLPCIDPEEDFGVIGGAGPIVSGVTLEVMSDDNEWVSLGDVPTRDISVTEAVEVEAGLVSGSEVTIRISWEGSFEIDSVLRYQPADADPVISFLELANTETKVVNEVNTGISEFGGEDPVELHLGDVFQFSFEAGKEPAEGLERIYVIYAVGRYQPDYKVYSNLVPSLTALHSNFPNPFNPSTTIKFDLAKPGRAILSIYNVKGALVRTLTDEFIGAGSHSFVWDGQDKAGKRLSSGTYFYTLTAGDFSKTRKMLLLK